MDSLESNLDPSLDTMPPHQNIMPHPHGQYPSDRVTVVVDRQHFIHTRNALNNAFMSLSSSIDRAVKAYADHTDAVIQGDHALDVSGLLMPFNQITQYAQQFNPAFFTQYSNGQTPLAPTEGAPTTGKKKRAYKQRDVNAPKRPLTAYFRFLKEQRPIITSENAETPGGEGSKAGDISKIATERWHALTDAQRNPYKLAYQHELEQYERETKAYKETLASAVKLGAEEDDELMATPSAGPALVVAKADAEDEEDEDDDDEDDDSDDSTSSEEDASSDESDEDLPAKAPSPPAKKSKSAKKAVTAGADPAASQPMFSSLNPVGAPSSSAGQKRKAEDDSGGKKKRGRPTKAEQEAAAAASQLLADESADAKKERKKKEKKEKKRKSEAA